MCSSDLVVACMMYGTPTRKPVPTRVTLTLTPATYSGFYLLLTGICLHFLWGNRRKSRSSQNVLTAYTAAMFVTTTIYFVAGCVWSEKEFVENAANSGSYAKAMSTPLAMAKDWTISINMWLADSLIVS